MTESKHLSVHLQLQISFFKIQGEGGTVYRVDEIRFLIGKQCSILLLFALVLCVQKLEKLHNGTFLANWANPTWFQKDSQFDCFIVTFRVLHVSILYIFLLFSPTLVPFIMLWGLKLFRNNNHIIVEKNRENATITATTLIWREKYK